MNNKKLLLPEVQDRKQYAQLFKEDARWEKSIQFLVDKHQLNGKIQRGVLGSHIVYRVGDCWIKLMAPIFAGDMAFEVSGLKTVLGQLSVSSPKILAQGQVEAWSYIIISHIEGQSIRHVWSNFNFEQKIQLAAQMAQITIEISRCQADQVIMNRFSWNDFIQQQYDNSEQIQSKKDLPSEWLAQLGPFLKKFDLAEFKTETPVFLHADLTFDHFLVAGGDKPQISGVIDMADCQVGHFEYELIAPAVFIFKGQNQLLKHYLLRCGFPEAQLNLRFSEKLMAWTLLHRYCAIKSYFTEEMNSCLSANFTELAGKVFPL